MKEHGITISEYTGDNGIYQSKLFKSFCDALNQKITYCGINAHHQNGITECNIQTITECTHTMLILAMTEWPDVITTELWPFALKLAIDIQNATPTDSGLSPEEIFTRRKSRNRLKDFHTFGCPVFVLEVAL